MHIHKKASIQSREDVTVKKGGEHFKWPNESVKARGQLKMSAAMKPWTKPTGRARPKLQGVLVSARCRDVLNIAFWKLRRESDEPHEDLVRDAWCNVSQTVSRLPCRRGSLPTFACNSLIYSFQHDQTLTGSTHLRVIGWPLESMPGTIFSDSELRNLAGESFSVCLATVLQTAIFLMPEAVWWRDA